MTHLPVDSDVQSQMRHSPDKNFFCDEYHPARTKRMSPAFYHPVKALLELLTVNHGWRATHHGVKHEDARLELETWNSWLSCDFTPDSIERFPLSLWERFRLARAAGKLSHRLIMKALLPNGSSRTLHGTVIESICLHPQDWEVCTDVVHHRASGLELVTRDGPLLVRCSPMSRVHFRIGFFQRLTLWLAIKRLIRRTVAGRIQQTMMTLRRQAAVLPS